MLDLGHVAIATVLVFSKPYLKFNAEKCKLML